jgi:hypothetical protein
MQSVPEQQAKDVRDLSFERGFSILRFNDEPALGSVIEEILHALRA